MGDSASLDAGAAGARVLAELWRRPVELTNGRQLNAGLRSHVWRFTVSIGPGEAPPTVIVKRTLARGESRWPEASDGFPTPATRLRTERAALLALALPDEPPLVPKLLAASPRRGLLVMEDVAGAVGLHDVLRNGPVRIAESALIRLAAALSRLHGATPMGTTKQIGRHRPVFRKAFRAAVRPERIDAALAAACDAVGVARSPALRAELRVLHQFFDGAGPFGAMLHGDVCPDNVLVEPDGVRLLDLELSTRGHALADAVFARLGFPGCWCSGLLPAPVVSQIEQAYRTGLAAACPAAGDDRLFGAAIVEACAFWTVGSLSWALPKALAADEGWGESPLRRRIVLQLDATAFASARHRHLEAVGALCAALSEALRTRWGGTGSTPWFHAFQASAASLPC